MGKKGAGKFGKHSVNLNKRKRKADDQFRDWNETRPSKYRNPPKPQTKTVEIYVEGVFTETRQIGAITVKRAEFNKFKEKEHEHFLELEGIDEKLPCKGKYGKVGFSAGVVMRPEKNVVLVVTRDSDLQKDLENALKQAFVFMDDDELQEVMERPRFEESRGTVYKSHYIGGGYGYRHSITWREADPMEAIGWKADQLGADGDFMGELGEL